jgi:hypothetical protein
MSMPACIGVLSLTHHHFQCGDATPRWYEQLAILAVMACLYEAPIWEESLQVLAFTAYSCFVGFTMEDGYRMDRWLRFVFMVASISHFADVLTTPAVDGESPGKKSDELALHQAVVAVVWLTGVLGAVFYLRRRNALGAGFSFGDILKWTVASIAVFTISGILFTMLVFSIPTSFDVYFVASYLPSEFACVCALLVFWFILGAVMPLRNICFWTVAAIVLYAVVAALLGAPQLEPGGLAVTANATAAASAGNVAGVLASAGAHATAKKPADKRRRVVEQLDITTSTDMVINPGETWVKKDDGDFITEDLHINTGETWIKGDDTPHLTQDLHIRNGETWNKGDDDDLDSDVTFHPGVTRHYGSGVTTHSGDFGSDFGDVGSGFTINNGEVWVGGTTGDGVLPDGVVVTDGQLIVEEGHSVEAGDLSAFSDRTPRRRRTPPVTSQDASQEHGQQQQANKEGEEQDNPVTTMNWLCMYSCVILSHSKEWTLALLYASVIAIEYYSAAVWEPCTFYQGLAFVIACIATSSEKCTVESAFIAIHRLLRGPNMHIGPGSKWCACPACAMFDQGGRLVHPAAHKFRVVDCGIRCCLIVVMVIAGPWSVLKMVLGGASRWWARAPSSMNWILLDGYVRLQWGGPLIGQLICAAVLVYDACSLPAFVSPSIVEGAGFVLFHLVTRYTSCSQLYSSYFNRSNPITCNCATCELEHLTKLQVGLQKAVKADDVLHNLRLAMLVIAIPYTVMGVQLEFGEVWKRVHEILPPGSILDCAVVALIFWVLMLGGQKLLARKDRPEEGDIVKKAVSSFPTLLKMGMVLYVISLFSALSASDRATESGTNSLGRSVDVSDPGLPKSRRLETPRDFQKDLETGASFEIGAGDEVYISEDSEDIAFSDDMLYTGEKFSNLVHAEVQGVQDKNQKQVKQKKNNNDKKKKKKQQTKHISQAVYSFSEEDQTSLFDIFDSAFDSNRSGFIDKNELAAIMDNIGRDPSEAAASLDSVDEIAGGDDDGKLSFDEFLSLLTISSSEGATPDDSNPSTDPKVLLTRRFLKILDDYRMNQGSIDNGRVIVEGGTVTVDGVKVTGASDLSNFIHNANGGTVKMYGVTLQSDLPSRPTNKTPPVTKVPPAPTSKDMSAKTLAATKTPVATKTAADRRFFTRNTMQVEVSEEYSSSYLAVLWFTIICAVVHLAMPKHLHMYHPITSTFRLGGCVVLCLWDAVHYMVWIDSKLGGVLWYFNIWDAFEEPFTVKSAMVIVVWLAAVVSLLMFIAWRIFPGRFSSDVGGEHKPSAGQKPGSKKPLLPGGAEEVKPQQRAHGKKSKGKRKGAAGAGADTGADAGLKAEEERLVQAAAKSKAEEDRLAAEAAAKAAVTAKAEQERLASKATLAAVGNISHVQQEVTSANAVSAVTQELSRVKLALSKSEKMLSASSTRTATLQRAVSKLENTMDSIRDEAARAAKEEWIAKAEADRFKEEARAAREAERLAKAARAAAEEKFSALRQQQEDDAGCIICMEKHREAVFVPCGHRCCCLVCALSTSRRGHPCPICREPIEKAIPVYL